MTETSPETPGTPPPAESGGCCCGDPYSSLPPEARPKPSPRVDGLRETRCPKCGLVYLTNRSTDVCIRCT